jgi:putative oxidoreductase
MSRLTPVTTSSEDPTMRIATTAPSTATTTSRVDAALAVLRATTGTIFVAHGAQKLFVYGFAGVTGAFGQMGVPLPQVAGPATALVEFLGGLALIAGLFTRLSGLGLAITMIGAIGLVHLGGGFFNPNGIEFPLALLGATLALAVSGAGRFSLDALIAGRRTSATTAEEPARTLSRAA